MGSPLEQDNTYFVLRPNTTIPVKVQDIRPLEIDELRLTEDQWQQRSVQFDSNGRIIDVPSTNTPLPTLRNLLKRHDDKRFSATVPSDPRASTIECTQCWSVRGGYHGDITSSPPPLLHHAPSLSWRWYDTSRYKQCLQTPAPRPSSAHNGGLCEVGTMVTSHHPNLLYYITLPRSRGRGMTPHGTSSALRPPCLSY